MHNRFEADKHAWEEAIRGYVGNDPLDLWFNYITWYEQNRTYDRVNSLRAILEKCLAQYQETESYKQDIRLVKLWMKFVRSRGKVAWIGCQTDAFPFIYLPDRHASGTALLVSDAVQQKDRHPVCQLLHQLGTLLQCRKSVSKGRLDL